MLCTELRRYAIRPHLFYEMMTPRGLLPILVIWLASGRVCAQDLTPRAYLITPVGSNAVTLSYSFSDGSVFTDPTLPITDSKARFSAQIFSYYHSFSLLGRSANVVGSVPYALGNFRGIVADAEKQAYRSGLADTRFRVSVNLKGGPAMSLREFVEWREKTTVGASLTVAAPTGQYDPARAINPGLHRWAVKPELGFSRRFGGWSVDLYGGMWFFAANPAFFPGNNMRTQAPVASAEAHLVRYLTRRCWLSLDTNYWTGGRTTVGATRKADYQRNSRVGATVAIPLNQRQSFKFGFSAGAYIPIGGDYRNFSVGWQYSWLHGRP